MNAEISVFVICVEAIKYLLLYNLHDCTFKSLFVKNMNIKGIVTLFSCDSQKCILFKQLRKCYQNTMSV